ncbi:uncharacterized protein LOC128556862 [Mercenaria mercenaria]|uniref:uncharacterized protein LOC128556862 n=1 Tax=Mercenaria mercenaria TaxID=6596 RepID=UPI00234E506B|nr:uncharacterized protein LOC128556862 [Mercenaria mercenaria]
MTINTSKTQGVPQHSPDGTATPQSHPAVSAPQPVNLNPQQLVVVVSLVAEHHCSVFARRRSILDDDSRHCQTVLNKMVHLMCSSSAYTFLPFSRYSFTWNIGSFHMLMYGHDNVCFPEL